MAKPFHKEINLGTFVRFHLDRAMIVYCVQSVISIMVGHFNYKHRCLVEKNVPIVPILPSRWLDGAESLGMECTSCL